MSDTLLYSIFFYCIFRSLFRREKDALWQKNDALEFEQKLRDEETERDVNHCVGCRTQFSWWLRKYTCRSAEQQNRFAESFIVILQQEKRFVVIRFSVYVSLQTVRASVLLLLLQQCSQHTAWWQQRALLRALLQSAQRSG